MENAVQAENEKQITTGKNKLRHRIKELELEAKGLQDTIAQAKATEQARFEERHKEVEVAAEMVLADVQRLLLSAKNLVRKLYGTEE